MTIKLKIAAKDTNVRLLSSKGFSIYIKCSQMQQEKICVLPTVFEPRDMLELEDFVPEVQNTFRLWDLDLARNLYSPRLMDIQMTNKALKTVEREGLLAFVGIDEYNTSQVRLDLLYGL